MMFLDSIDVLRRAILWACRWYYWADHLGILVWQDMPAMFWEDNVVPNPSDQGNSFSIASAPNEYQQLV